MNEVDLDLQTVVLRMDSKLKNIFKDAQHKLIWDSLFEIIFSPHACKIVDFVPVSVVLNTVCCSNLWLERLCRDRVVLLVSKCEGWKEAILIMSLVHPSKL